MFDDIGAAFAACGADDFVVTVTFVGAVDVIVRTRAFPRVTMVMLVAESVRMMKVWLL